MMNFLRNLFPFLDRRSRFARLQDRGGAFARRVGPRRGGLALGTLASIAAPFIIRRFRNRQAQRAF
jgi:hypothetical protein